MENQGDTNAAIWRSPEAVQAWSAEAQRQERTRAEHRYFLAGLLPFGPRQAFTFLDLGAGTEAAARRQHRTPLEQARWDNHIRYIIPLGPQLDYLRSAGFEGVDVYWKQLEKVIYGGRRPD